MFTPSEVIGTGHTTTSGVKFSSAMSRVLTRTQTRSIAQVEDRLEELGAVRSSARWRFACNYLRQHELFLCHTVEAPAVHFVVTKASEGASGERVVRVGMEHSGLLDLAQANTQRLKVLLDGSVHTCGDFVVRAGQLFLNGTLNGVAIEVEYLPCALATAAAAPLAAFVDVLLARGDRDFCSSEVECFRDVQNLPHNFDLEHSVLLLIGLMRSRLGVPSSRSS